MPYIELMFVSRGKKKGRPLISETPLARERRLLAPHGGDALEDDTAHERNTHTEADKGKRSIHAQLDRTHPTPQRKR